jgi:hypothetical protein
MKEVEPPVATVECDLLYFRIVAQRALTIYYGEYVFFVRAASGVIGLSPSAL